MMRQTGELAYRRTTGQDMHRVLFIAYYFPPIGGSGVQRPAKFVKYLSEFGWRPYVISTDGGRAQVEFDQTLLGDIPSDVPVWRVPTPHPTPVNWLARWIGWRGNASQAGKEAQAASPGDSLGSSGPLWKRLRRMLLSPVYLIQEPLVDDALYWSLRIVPLAKTIVEREGIDLILVTAPPWSPLLAASLLGKLTNRPWVADFRDLWTDDTVCYTSTGIRRWLDKWLEGLVVSRANAVVSVSEPCLQILCRKAEERMMNKPVSVITNGWDRSDLAEGGREQLGVALNLGKDGTVTLVHPGSSYRGETTAIVRALRLLSSPEVSRQLRFHFVGYVHPQNQAEIGNSERSSSFQIERQRVSHPEAIELMRTSHILLLLGNDSFAARGKTFEYMLIGRPVLAISYGPEAALIRECGIGCVVHPDDIGRLAQVLRHIALDYEGFVAEYYHPNWEEINRYDRRALTQQLAEVFARVIASRESP
jgi:glycosyltransferase involved in cell wall biosynthesis